MIHKGALFGLKKITSDPLFREAPLILSATETFPLVFTMPELQQAEVKV